MAVRTKRLAAFNAPLATATQYTCPSGETAIVKTVTAFNGNLVTAATLVLRSVMGGLTVVWLTESIPAGSARRFDTWIVLHPADNIRADASQAGTVVSISGTELEGVAD